MNQLALQTQEDERDGPGARLHYRGRPRPLLESGRYATVRDLAKAEAINESYLGRILRLTLLSPTIIEAILEGR